MQTSVGNFSPSCSTLASFQFYCFNPAHFLHPRLLLNNLQKVFTTSPSFNMSLNFFLQDSQCKDYWRHFSILHHIILLLIVPVNTYCSLHPGLFLVKNQTIVYSLCSFLCISHQVSERFTMQVSVGTCKSTICKEIHQKIKQAEIFL